MNTALSLQQTIVQIDSLSDIRTQKWPFVQTPYFALLCVMSYCLFIIFGPGIMRARKSMDLKGAIVIYNGILVSWNAYMFYLFMKHAFLNPNFNLVCDVVDYSEDSGSIMLAWALYIYYISKLVELLDTVFFILRKKNNQVTFLHVYHHATMPLLWWIGAKFVAGGESYLSPLVNSFVHVVMYAYYGLSAFGPWIQPYLWWKKYITILQMTQFVIVISKTIFTIGVGCAFPNAYLFGQLAYMLSMLVLFLDFYRQTYRGPSKAAKTASNGLSNGHAHDGEVVKKTK